MKRFFRGLGIFLLLIGVGIISAFAVVALLLRQEEVRVPDLAGQDIVTVIETLNQQNLLLKVDRRETSSTLARDMVVSQMPAAGSGIKKGRQIHVVLSLGPSEMQAPKVVGEHFRKADVLIRQAGYFPGTVARIPSDAFDRDTVIAQDPQGGSLLDKGGKISLLISTGRKQEMLVMPRLTGKKAEEAARIIDRMGLQKRLVFAPSSNAGERTVIQQKPAADFPVSPDTVVEIVVAK